MTELTDEQRAFLAERLPLTIDEDNGVDVLDVGKTPLFSVEGLGTTLAQDAILAAAIVHCVNEYPALERELRLTRRALELAVVSAENIIGNVEGVGIGEAVQWYLDKARRELEARK